MRIQILLIGVLFCSLLNYSCFREDCNNPGFELILINFTNSDLDSLIFKTYQAGINYTLLKDSIRIKNRNCFSSLTGRDTQTLICDTLFRCSELVDMEWQIAGSGIRKRISSISIKQSQQTHGLLAFDQWPCYNPISYFEDSLEVDINKYQSDLLIPIYFKK